jgi:hypothetical protein
MTVADTNVRPAWRSPATSARGTRRWGLARLLLKPLGRLLRKLDLTFLVLLAVAPTPACIIPVGPDWRDPFGTPNAPPQILDPFPELGPPVTVMLPYQQMFRIFVTDVNGDNLEIKWFVDGFDRPNSKPLVDQNGIPQRTLCEKTVTCADIAPELKGLPSHLVRAAVADERFDINDPLKVTKGGLSVEVFWTLIMACQQ